jgi:hypothetical protein
LTFNLTLFLGGTIRDGPEEVVNVVLKVLPDGVRLPVLTSPLVFTVSAVVLGRRQHSAIVLLAPEQSLAAEVTPTVLAAQYSASLAGPGASGRWSWGV